MKPGKYDRKVPREAKAPRPPVPIQIPVTPPAASQDARPGCPARERANAVRNQILVARIQAARAPTFLGDAMRRHTAQTNRAFIEMVATMRKSSISMEQANRAFRDMGLALRPPPPAPGPHIEKE